jgi:hypothetical protein
MKHVVVGAQHQFEAIVSDEDYLFLVNWRWSFARSHPRSGRELIYARRCVTVTDFELVDRWGGKTIVTKKFDLFMHHVVLARMGYPEPPRPGWTADHINTRTIDNRRENLRWASPTFQALNRASHHDRSPEHARMVAEALLRMAPEHTISAPLAVPVASLRASCGPAPAPGGTGDPALARRLTAEERQ